MKLLPANPGLTDLDEHRRSIHRRVRKLREQGNLDDAEERRAVLDLARLIAMREKIEASRPVKKRRRKATPAPQARDVS